MAGQGRWARSPGPRVRRRGSATGRPGTVAGGQRGWPDRTGGRGGVAGVAGGSREGAVGHTWAVRRALRPALEGPIRKGRIDGHREQDLAAVHRGEVGRLRQGRDGARHQPRDGREREHDPGRDPRGRRRRGRRRPEGLRRRLVRHAAEGALGDDVRARRRDRGATPRTSRSSRPRTSASRSPSRGRTSPSSPTTCGSSPAPPATSRASRPASTRRASRA